MAKVKGTNKRTRAKRSYTKPGSKRGRGVKQDGRATQIWHTRTGSTANDARIGIGV